MTSPTPPSDPDPSGRAAGGTGPGLVLASASPRRHELLGRLGVLFSVTPADIDETPFAAEEPVAYVQRLAEEKAAVVAAGVGGSSIVLAADTTVDLDGVVFGKPADRAEAATMLRALAGRAHLVHTGVALRLDARLESFVVTTEVVIVPFDTDTHRWYLDTGEWNDKAGAYALQGCGGCLVAEIRGSVSSVVGLPLAETVDAARRMGVSLLG